MIRFEWRGVQIEVRFFFVGLLTLCFLFDRSFVAVLGILAAMMHECGHLILLAHSGCKPKRIAFECTGVVIVRHGGTLSYQQEIPILLAGSSVNFLYFIFSLLWHGSVDGVSTFAVVHLVLGCVNLLPFYGLDGGKILYALLLGRLSERKVEVGMIIIQLVIILILFTICISSFLEKKLNFSAFILLFYLLFMMFTSPKT